MADINSNIFESLYKSYKQNLYNYVLKMVSKEEYAEDIVQNVFIKLQENLDSINKPGSTHFWIFKTARNEIYKHYKSKSVRKDRFIGQDTDELEIESLQNIELEYERKELFEYISKELDKLTIEQKEVYILKEYSQLSYKEISVILNADENVLRKRLFDAKNKLIKKLSNIYLAEGAK